MEVRHVGRIPGSLETHQSYTWVDEFGRTVSPPPEVDQSGRYNTTDGRKSGLMLLKDTDERKVNLVVSESKTLGISIRGGNEFGLGIYITQVDYGSPADNAGLKVGDQIMDVNGRTFLDISHGDAVKVLKSSRHLMITVKDVGKLPYARTTYDHTEWIPDDQLTLTARQQPRHANKGTVRAETSSLSGRYATLQATDSMFCRGAGSQLMHNSMMSHTTQMALIEESARSLLNDNQHATLKYYIDDYQKGFIQVEALLLALFEVLNTKRKFALLTDIRGIIHPKDLKTFDHLVLQKEVTLLKSKSMESLYPLPHESDDESMDISYSHYGWPKTSNQVTSQASEEEIDALRQAIELIENDRRQERKSQKKGHKLKIGLGSLKGKKKHTVPPIPDTKADAEIHKTDRRLRKDARCSSEDSGVEVNGSGHTSQNTSTNQKKEACSRTNASSNGYHGKYMSLGRKNAYSLIDTAVSDGSNPNPMQSSPSELEDRLDMFKTLPAQFESEMVHANIQTEEDWSNTSSGFGSQEHSRNEDNPQKVRLFSVASEGDLRSISPSVVLHHNKGDRTMDSLLQISPLDGATEAALDQMNGAKREESNQDGLGRPQKPPRTHRSISRKQSAVECEQEDMRSIASSIPDINLDHMCTSGSLRTWDKDSELTLEPLSIVPPPPPSDQLDKSSSTAVDANNYKLFDIPFDDMDLSYAVAPPTQTSLQLSPIAIVPPPPPMESTFGLDNLRLDSDSPLLQNSNHGNTDHQTPPPRQTSPDDNDVMKSVVIHKTRPTLGLAIEGGAKTRQPLPRIINIQPGGAAAQCHDLEIGDVIVQVNGQPLDGKLHRQCAKIIATAFKDKQTNTMVLGISKCSRKMKV